MKNAMKTNKLKKRDKINKDSLKIFTDRLCDLLDSTSENFKMTAAELSIKANISTGIISQYRNATVMPRIDKLHRIACVLNTSTDFLLGRTDIVNGDASDVAISDRFGLSEASINILDKIKEKNNEDEGYTNVLNFILSNDFFIQIIEKFYVFKRAHLLLEKRKKWDMSEIINIHPILEKADDTTLTKALSDISPEQETYDNAQWHIERAFKNIVNSIDKLSIPLIEEEVDDIINARRLKISVEAYRQEVKGKEKNDGEK